MPCTSSPVVAATAWPGRARRRRCAPRPRRRRRPPHRGVRGRTAHRLLPRRHPAPRRPVPARPHPAGRPRRPQMTPLGHGLFASDGEVVLGSARLAESDEGMPLRAAVVAARAGLPIAPATLDNLARHAPTPTAPWHPALRDLFGDLLASGPGLVPSGRAWTRWGSSARGCPSGPRSLPAPAQRRAPPHRRPAPRRDRRARRRPGAPRSRPDLLLARHCSTTSARSAAPTTTPSPGRADPRHRDPLGLRAP